MLLILDPLKKTGQLTRLHDYFSGKRASIQSSTQHQEDLFVPDETHAQIEGVTQLPQDLVDAATRCQNPDVELIMAPDEAYYPKARTLRIKPNKITGRVDIIYPFNRILILDNQSVFVDPRARIIDHHGIADTMVTWNRIATGDKLICYGLKTCSSAEYDFHAMTILIKK